MRKIEYKIQAELVKWIRKTYPEVDIRMNKLDGLKDMIEIMQDKRLGTAIKGTPDLTLFCDYNNTTYILELELKTLKGTLNDNQKVWWGKFTPTQNKTGEIAYGFLKAKEIIENWIKSFV